MSTDKKTIKWYNSHAKAYLDHVRDPKDSPYHSLYEKPAMYSLLPDLTNKKVLSLGCGSGEDSHHLKTKGAKESVGIDISRELIKSASQTYRDCEFHEMDMEKLDFPDEEFDFAYSSLAIHYIENWTIALKEVYRVIKPDSYFLFSCEHPIDSAMTRIETESEKQNVLMVKRDKATNKETIIGDYLTHGIIGDKNWDVTRWHKSISEICQEISDSGFVITNIVEPIPLPEMEKVHPSNYLKLLKIPYFLIFKLKKL